MQSIYNRNDILHQYHVKVDVNWIWAQKIGNLLFQNNQIDQAIDIYQNIIENHPDYDFNIDGIGNIEEMDGYFQQKIYRWYDGKKKSSQLKGSPYDGLSLCYLQTKKYSKGLVWYKKMLQTYPNNYQLLQGCANLYYNQKSYYEAIKFYKKVIEIKPKFVRAYMGLMWIAQFRLEDQKKSKQWTDLILKQQHHNQFAMYIKSRHSNDVEERLKQLMKIHIMFPNYAKIPNQIGFIYNKFYKNRKQALSWHQKSSSINSIFLDSFVKQAQIFKIIKNYQKLEEICFIILSKNQQYKIAYNLLCSLYQMQKKQDNYILDKMRLSSINPVVFIFRYAQSLMIKAKEKRKACFWFKKALKYDQQDIRIYLYLGEVLLKRHKYESSLKYFTFAHQMNHCNITAMLSIASIYRQKKQLKIAIEWYQKVICENSSNFTAYCALGQIYSQMNKKQQAIFNFNNAVKYDSSAYSRARLAEYSQKLSNFNEADKHCQTMIDYIEKYGLCETDNPKLVQPLMEKYYKRKSGFGFGKIQSKLKFLRNKFENKFKKLFNQDQKNIQNQTKQKLFILPTRRSERLNKIS